MKKYLSIMMMWAEHCHRLELLPLLSAQWHWRSLERGWQIFFGGVFDKRVGMLFAARRNEDGNVHRRDGVSKTVTKNMRVGFFENKKIKAPPDLSADKAGNAPNGAKDLTAVSAVSSFSMEIFPDGSAKCSRLMVKSFSSFSRKHFEIDHLTKGSGFQPDELTQPSPFPGGLMQLFGLTAAAIGLTPPSIPTPDEGVKTPSDADVRTTCFDVLLLAVPGLTLDASVRVLATFGRHVDADDALMKKTFKQLITNEYC